MISQVLDSLAQWVVRLNPLTHDLFVQPGFEIVHDWLAGRLVVNQALLWRIAVLPANRVVVINQGQSVDHKPAFVGETVDDFDEVSASVGQAKSDQLVLFDIGKLAESASLI